MQKNIVFRIIDLPTHQVLLTKEIDDIEDEEQPIISITFFIDGVKVCQKMGYQTLEKRDEMFNIITQEQAQHTVDLIVNMIS